jgi:hypothetical protein
MMSLLKYKLLESIHLDIYIVILIQEIDHNFHRISHLHHFPRDNLYISYYFFLELSIALAKFLKSLSTATIAEKFRSMLTDEDVFDIYK